MLSLILNFGKSNNLSFTENKFHLLWKSLSYVAIGFQKHSKQSNFPFLRLSDLMKRDKINEISISQPQTETRLEIENYWSMQDVSHFHTFVLLHFN